VSLEKAYQNWRGETDERRLSQALGFLHDLLAEDASKDDQILYTSLSKWAYFRQKYKVNGAQTRAMYWMRSELQRYKSDPQSYGDISQLVTLVDETVRWVFDTIMKREDVDALSVSGLLEEAVPYEAHSTDTHLLLEERIEDSIFLARDPLQPAGQIFKWCFRSNEAFLTSRSHHSLVQCWNCLSTFTPSI
jgi:hypothetical protein